ncbi:MAG: hypothetical protein OQL19_03120 [Gammaproteobacteria bacterium]|nr:hypothetical protein [Gammaproteobacteria bacterium]
MIYFEGYQQLYRIEELSLERATQILEQQLNNDTEAKESTEDIINCSYSYRTNLDRHL